MVSIQEHRPGMQQVSDGALCSVGSTLRPVIAISDHMDQWQRTMVLFSDTWAASVLVELRCLDHNVMNSLPEQFGNYITRAGMRKVLAKLRNKFPGPKLNK